MSLRVTQSQLYGKFTNGMNKSLLDLVESNLQAATQLKVNRPSDDPAASGMIVTTKASLSRLTTYKSNISNAQGWLGVSDSILASSGSVMTVLTQIQTLAQQGATGTYTKENRAQIGGEVYQHFLQLMNLANSTYAGKHIFSGHKTDVAPYQESLGITCRDNGLWLSNTWPTDSVTDVKGSFKDNYDVSIHNIDTVNGIVTYTYTGADGIPSEPVRAIIKNDKADITLPGGSVSVDTTKLATGTFQVAEPRVSGASKDTIIIQPEASGLASTVNYRYSSDGGLTWTHGIVPTVNIADGTVSIATNEGVTVTVGGNTMMQEVPLDEPQEKPGQTWIVVRPSAIYQGDDHDTQVAMSYGVNGTISTDISGYFSRDITVRIDSTDTTATPPVITYSYSLNDGSSWTQAEATYDPAIPQARLSVPGGFLSLKTSALPPNDDIGADLKSGDQFIIHPHRADINIAISDHDAVTVNLIGKDIFGGQYRDPKTGEIYAVGNGGDDNLFEVIGELVGHCMTGDQTGIQKNLAQLQEVMKKITTNAAVVGGRWNRLEVTAMSVENREYEETSFLSGLQDVDVSELMIRQAQQQVAYNSVLKSTSMIMQMSLVNFL